MQDLDRAILLASLALGLIGSRSYSVIFRFGQAQVKFLSTPVQQHAWVHANSTEDRIPGRKDGADVHEVH